MVQSASGSPPSVAQLVEEEQCVQAREYSQRVTSGLDSPGIDHGRPFLPSLVNQREASWAGIFELGQVNSFSRQGPREHSPFPPGQYSEQEESVEEVRQTRGQEKRASLLPSVAVDPPAQHGRLLQGEGRGKQEPLLSAAVTGVVMVQVEEVRQTRGQEKRVSLLPSVAVDPQQVQPGWVSRARSYEEREPVPLPLSVDTLARVLEKQREFLQV